MKRIAVLTSGGDAPGMNAAIRAVVRTGLDRGWQVFGIQHGYVGLVNDNKMALEARNVGGIIHQGGTMLGSSRCPEFETEEGRLKALRTLQGNGIDALIVIGGNGSQTGAYELSKLGYPVIGIASTIDNDLYGADITIGVDTALDVALEAIDRIKVTASSHERAFIVEVMGREFGYLALMVGLAGGADAIIIPEAEIDPESAAAILRAAYERGKSHALIVVAEGAKNNADKLAHHFQKHQQRLGFEVRATILGHVQRGGTPGSFDRLLASRLGAAATEHLARGEHGVLLGLIEDKIRATSLKEVASHKKKLDLHLLELATILAK
jgi:6-phosphofructokinase 1